MIRENETFGMINMNWNTITSENQLDDLVEKSTEKAVLIFKHSTRCSISAMVKSRLEHAWDDSADIEPYYLDLIRYRNISNEIASKFNIHHESPQAILLKDGKVAHHSSHMGISVDNMKAAAKS